MPVPQGPRVKYIGEGDSVGVGTITNTDRTEGIYYVVWDCGAASDWYDTAELELVAPSDEPLQIPVTVNLLVKALDEPTAIKFAKKHLLRILAEWFAQDQLDAIPGRGYPDGSLLIYTFRTTSKQN